MTTRAPLTTAATASCPIDPALHQLVWLVSNRGPGNHSPLLKLVFTSIHTALGSTFVKAMTLNSRRVYEPRLQNEPVMAGGRAIMLVFHGGEAKFEVVVGYIAKISNAGFTSSIADDFPPPRTSFHHGVECVNPDDLASPGRVSTTIFLLLGKEKGLLDEAGLTTSSHPSFIPSPPSQAYRLPPSFHPRPSFLWITSISTCA